MRMMNYGTTTLNHILLMGKTTKDNESLWFKGESLETKYHVPTNAIQISRIHYHNGSKKNRSSKRQNLRCYYCKKLGHIRKEFSHFLMHQKVRQQKQHLKTKQIRVVKGNIRCLVACTSLEVNINKKMVI